MRSPPSLPLCVGLLIVQSAIAESPTPSPIPRSAIKGEISTAPAEAGFDKSALLGTWEGFVVEGDGSKPSRRIANVSLTITPDKITSSTQGSRGEGTYRVSAGNGRWHNIDGTGVNGMYQGKLYKGIFTLEDNTIQWYSAEVGRPRPTAFRTNFAAGNYLMILTRKP